MSRRICVESHREFKRSRPDWDHEDDEQGPLKVAMTGSASDPPNWQAHTRNKPCHEVLANRFRDDADPLRIVLVRDMWLTGFDGSRWMMGTPQEHLGLLAAAQEHILRQENDKDRLARVVRELSQAFGLAVPHPEALRIRDDIAFAMDLARAASADVCTNPARTE